MPKQSPLATVEEMTEGRSVKFHFKRGRKKIEGFLACYQGQVVAFENECRHLPVSLDYGLGRFFTRDGRYFICQTHSALYDPTSGLCVEGPCAGQKLKPIPLKIKDGLIFLDYKRMPSSTKRTGIPSRTG